MKRGEDFDLLFMDIELGDMNGIEAVNFLRNEMGNEQMRIVFVSAISSYANELFKHDVMNFLVKPITYEAVDEVLSKYIRVYYNDNRAFTFKYMRKKFKFSYDDIIYFENENGLCISTQLIRNTSFTARWRTLRTISRTHDFAGYISRLS